MARSKADKFAYEFGSAERVEFVRWLPCVVCQCSPCDNHHVFGGGMSRKGPARAIVPLCVDYMTGCHSRLHSVGKLSFLQAAMKGGGLRVGGYVYEQWEEAAAAVDRAWLEYSEGLSH